MADATEGPEAEATDAVGVVVCRVALSGASYLLLRSRRGEWTPPKVNLSAGRTPRAAAEALCKRVTSCAAPLRPDLGVFPVEYEVPGEQSERNVRPGWKRTLFYVTLAPLGLRPMPAAEWVRLPAALSRVAHAELQQLLAAVHEALAASPDAVPPVEAPAAEAPAAVALDDLPADVVPSVLAHLDRPALAALSAASHAWHAATARAAERALAAMAALAAPEGEALDGVSGDDLWWASQLAPALVEGFMLAAPNSERRRMAPALCGLIARALADQGEGRQVEACGLRKGRAFPAARAALRAQRLCAACNVLARAGRRPGADGRPAECELLADMVDHATGDLADMPGDVSGAFVRCQVVSQLVAQDTFCGAAMDSPGFWACVRFLRGCLARLAQDGRPADWGWRALLSATLIALFELVAHAGIGCRNHCAHGAKERRGFYAIWRRAGMSKVLDLEESFSTPATEAARDGLATLAYHEFEFTPMFLGVPVLGVAPGGEAELFSASWNNARAADRRSRNRGSPTITAQPSDSDSATAGARPPTSQ